MRRSLGKLAYNNLANKFETLGRLELAAQHDRKAIAIKPDYAEAHRHLVNLESPTANDNNIKIQELFPRSRP